MILDDERTVDWVNLPAGLEETIIWACLHDANLQSIRTDALERLLSLEFEVTHLNEHKDALRFIFTLSGVESIRALKWQNWSGDFHAPTDVSYDENIRLVSEYKAKGREESVTWSDFEE
jgi:hypothetical protein